MLTSFIIADPIDQIVASNDTEIKSTTHISEVPSLDDLESSRKQWETTAYRTSNAQLYAILSDCYRFATAELTGVSAKARRKLLDQFLQSRNYRVKSDSPLLTRVVKAVFGDVDRRRISTYSLVLRSAHMQSVTAEDLPKWIELMGGIQEIKLSRSASYMSAKQRAEEAKSSLSTLRTLAIVKDGLSEFTDAEFVGHECVLLAEQQADGSFHIKSLTRSNTAINAALTALYSDNKRASH